MDIRTIERIVEQNKEELEKSGNELFSFNKLKLFKEHVANFVNNAKTKRLEEKPNILIKEKRNSYLVL